MKNSFYPKIRILSLMILMCFSKFIHAQANNNMCTPSNITMGATTTRSYASAGYAYLNTHIDTVYGSDSIATIQAGEPLGTCGMAGPPNKTLWYQFTAPKCGTPSLIFSTDDRSRTNYDTRIAVYRKSSTSCTATFTEIACNNDATYYLNSGPTLHSTVTLNPNNGGSPSANQYVPGENLYIQISRNWVDDSLADDFFGLIVDAEPYVPTTNSATAGSVVIDWSTAMTSPWGNIANTYVQWRVVGSSGGGSYRTVFAPASSTTITGLLPGTNYEYFVSYVCAAGGKWWSKKGYFTTLSTCTGSTPSITSVVNGSTICNRPVVTFSASSFGYTSYKVARRKVGMAAITLSPAYAPSASPLTWASATSLTYAANYQYWVYAYCGTAKVDSSPITTFTVCPVARNMSVDDQNESTEDIETAAEIIQEEASNNEISFIASGTMDIFPNPSNTETSINYSMDQIVDQMEIQLIDAQGKELLNQTITNPELSGSIKLMLDNYTKGIYFVKLKAGEYTEIKKLSIN